MRMASRRGPASGSPAPRATLLLLRASHVQTKKPIKVSFRADDVDSVVEEAEAVAPAANALQAA